MSLRIALVDDDVPTREILAEWLSSAASIKLVSQYGDGASALAGLPQDHPDVALVDINLPKLSGCECVRQLKPILPRTQFVMLTAYDDSDNIFDALSAGATGYLLKQTSQEELIAAIHDVQAGGSPMSGYIARKVVQCFQHAPPPGSPTESLTTRELEVLDRLSRGFLYKEIGEQLGLSLHTINAYTRRIYEKLHVHSRSQAVARYLAGQSPEWPTEPDPPRR